MRRKTAAWVSLRQAWIRVELGTDVDAFGRGCGERGRGVYHGLSRSPTPIADDKLTLELRCLMRRVQRRVARLALARHSGRHASRSPGIASGAQPALS